MKTIDIEDMPQALILLLISVLFAVALVPTIIVQWQGVDTSAWNFTGAAGAIVLWGIAPFVLIAGIVLALVLALIVKKKIG